MNDYTHIAMIIDRSGSMASCWEDVQGGYTQMIKDNKDADGRCTFTVAAFDTDYELVEDFTDIQSVDDTLTVRPRGGTALLDAIGKTVVTVGKKLQSMTEADRPSKVLVVIQTDGFENSSKEFTKENVKSLITEQTEKYAWQFQFVGASLDAVNEAVSWGISKGNTSAYNSSNSENTFNVLNAKMQTMRSATTMDAYATCASFTEEEERSMVSEKCDA